MLKTMDKKTSRVLLYVFLFLIYIVLMILPADFFDKGQSLCISKLLLNKECYGCGMTRAIQHLLHFDFEIAYNFNKISFIVLPLTLFLILKDIYDVFFKNNILHKE